MPLSKQGMGECEGPGNVETGPLPESQQQNFSDSEFSWRSFSLFLSYTVLILVPWGAFEAQETLTIGKVDIWIWENLEISHKALK